MQINFSNNEKVFRGRSNGCEIVIEFSQTPSNGIRDKISSILTSAYEERVTSMLSYQSLTACPV